MMLYKTRKSVLMFLIFCSFSFVERADAATLYLSPASGSYTVGDVITVSMLVNTQGQTINSVDANITYPNKYLEVISISKSGSILSLWVEEPTFVNSSGTINLGGGLPTPGHNGGAGKIIDVTFKLKAAGSAQLAFSSGAVRANDGYGTNVLQASSGATFNISAPIKKPAPPPVTAPQPVKDVVGEPLKPDTIEEKLPEPIIIQQYKTHYSILILLILIIILLLLIIVYGRRRFVLLCRDMGNETKDGANQRSFEVMKEDITICATLLERAKERRSLTEEERILILLLERYTNETEKRKLKERQDTHKSIEGTKTSSV
jgi:hypothetical protein